MRLPGLKIILAFCLVGGGAAAQAPTPLPQLEAEAVLNNASVRAAELSWHAAEHGVAAARTLPDPQVTVQQMSVGNPLPFAGFESSNFAYVGVGVSQAIPYPGKLRLQAAIAQSNADALRTHWERARRAVAEQVTAAYIQLSYLDEALKVLDEQRTALEQAEQLAEVRYRTAQVSQADVLAGQREQTQLLRDLAVEQQQRESVQAALRALLNRPPGSPAITAEPLVETHLSQSEEQLLAALPSGDPALAGQQARIAGADEVTSLAKEDFKPDFNAQYMYQRTGPGFPDYYQWTVGMSLPVFHRASRQATVDQAVAEHAAAQAGYQDFLQQDRFTLTDRWLAAQSDEQVLQIDHDGLLPQAQAATQAALTAYSNGQGDLNSWLSAWRQALDLQQQYWHTLADHETALSVIEALTGVPHA